MHLWGYDLIAVTEKWKDRPHECSAGWMDTSYPVCKTAAGKQGALPGMGDEPAESLNVRISGQTNMDDVVMGVCYRPADQEEEIDVTFLRQLEEDSYS